MVRGMAAISNNYSLENLNKDVLLHISGYLELWNLGSLSTVCKALRSKLYDPIFWRGVAVKHDDYDNSISKEEAESYEQRDIKTIAFYSQSFSINLSLETISRVNSFTTISIDTDLLDDWSAEDVATLSFGTLKCFIFKVYQPFVRREDAETEELIKAKICEKFDRLFAILNSFLENMGNLNELHVYQADDRNLQHYNSNVLKSVDRHLPHLTALEYTKVCKREYVSCEEDNIGSQSKEYSNITYLAGVHTNFANSLKHFQMLST